MTDGNMLSVEIDQHAPIPLQVRFTCGPNQVLAVFGPSGSGKTTMLRVIAGLTRPHHARIVCGDEVWTDTFAGRDLPTRARRIGMVFQDYALFPHLTARGNVMAALGDCAPADRAREADRWLGAVHLTALAARKPAGLSGGERQRVALARALARAPRVLLLDEPFAAVDRAVRSQLHDELDDLRRRTGVPVILVTHDFQDVVRLATDVVLLDRGRMVAAGPIESIASRTDIPWPALSEAGSIIDTRVRAIDRARGLAELSIGGQPAFVPARHLTADSPVRVRVPAREVILAVRRPDGLSLHNVLNGTVAEINTQAGDHAVVQVRVGDALLLADVTRDAVDRLSLRPGVEVFALIKSMSIEVHGHASSRAPDPDATSSSAP